MSVATALRPRKRSPPRSRSRMEKIVERCLPWRYGEEYVPAFLATRTEGMTVSRIGCLPMPALSRKLHPQSAAEATIMCWVAYVPEVVDILENRPCCPVPGLPILAGHPFALPADLRPSSGTVYIANQLGIKHPVTSDDSWKQRGEIMPTRDFYPYTSDLLAIISRPNGGIRAVHLFVKKTEKQLNLVGRDLENYVVVRTYYAEGAIPTVKICPEFLDPIVSINLELCIRRARKPRGVTDIQLAVALQFMEQRIFESPPVTWIRPLWERCGIDAFQQEWIFHYGIYHRYLKIDLSRAIARDMVQRREKINFAADFAARFMEPI